MLGSVLVGITLISSWSEVMLSLIEEDSISLSTGVAFFSAGSGEEEEGSMLRSATVIEGVALTLAGSK